MRNRAERYALSEVEAFYKYGDAELEKADMQKLRNTFDDYVDVLEDFKVPAEITFKSRRFKGWWHFSLWYPGDCAAEKSHDLNSKKFEEGEKRIYILAIVRLIRCAQVICEKRREDG